jgi:hypothetical protein
VGNGRKSEGLGKEGISVSLPKKKVKKEMVGMKGFMSADQVL